MEMADNPQMTVVDPDAPTDKSVNQALASLPTWEEWLQQHGFVPQERTRFTGAQWNREWRDQGRGWKVRIAPAPDTINVIVYNNPLRYGKQLAMVSVAERSVPKVVQRLATEIEREVSDATKKRRVVAYTSSVPWEDREDKYVEERPVTNAAMRRMGLMDESVEPDPDEVSPEQLERALKRVRVHCIIPGQRVRVRRQNAGRLTGAMGTVVDATAHACYVAIDDYVNAGDPDPFRFTEDELEPVYENQEPDPDAPEPYLDALDCITPLKQLGYQLISGTYRKNLPLGDNGGRLKIEVEPQKQDVAAIIYVEFASLVVGEMRRVQDILVFSPFDIVDTCREIEKLAFAVDGGVCDFADALRAKGYKGTPVTNREHLYYIFGESAMEPDDVDNPQPYFQELQRHGEVINAFRGHGVRLKRRMSAERPYYEMFYIPNAVEDVSYDIIIEPDADQSWAVSASGLKEFTDERRGDWQEEFDIEQTWNIPAGADLHAVVDDLLSELQRHKGPEEPGAACRRVGESVDDPAGYVDKLARAQYCPRCGSHDTKCIGTHSRLPGGYGSGEPQEFWECNACADKFLWSDERSVGFKMEASKPVEPDPDDPQMMVNRMRSAKMGDIVDIVCPRCGDVHQSAKNWPDDAPKEWGFPCDKCGAHIPLVNTVIESVDDDIDPKEYANDVLYVDNTLTALGYHFAWNAHFPHWQKMIDPQLQFVVFVETDRFKWQFQAYRPTSDGKWALKTSSPGRDFSSIRADLEMWERKARAGELLSEAEEPEVDATAYANATFDPVQFLKENGWALHSEQHYTYYAKTFKLPRPYQLGGMTFTGVQVRVGIERSLFGTVSVGVYFVDDKDSGLGIQGYDLHRQQVYPWDEAEQGTAPERVYDNGMSIRRFAQGIEGVIANAKWPENRTAALLASNAVKAQIDTFIKQLNRGAAVPLYTEMAEALDPDEPTEDVLKQLPQQTFVTFTRQFQEDQEYAEANFPGEPLEQALGKQLLRELAEANVFDMSTIRVVGFERVDDDVYKVRLAFTGDYGSDETLRDLIQSTYREAAVAGEFNVEQYRPVKAQGVRCRHCGRSIRKVNGVWIDPAAKGDDSMWRETCEAHDTFTADHEPDDTTRSSGPQVEALDPDDPNLVLQSHPGFQFKDTSYLGVMVFIKGPGEDKSDWPQDIGRVVRGPEPDPPYARQRWYVIGVRGIVPEQLDEYGFGIHKHEKLRTFDTKEDAAMAIWLTWSRLDKKRQRGYLLPNT